MATGKLAVGVKPKAEPEGEQCSPKHKRGSDILHKARGLSDILCGASGRTIYSMEPEGRMRFCTKQEGGTMSSVQQEGERCTLQGKGEERHPQQSRAAE